MPNVLAFDLTSTNPGIGNTFGKKSTEPKNRIHGNPTCAGHSLWLIRISYPVASMISQTKRFASLLVLIGAAVFLLIWPATSYQQQPQSINIDHIALNVADLDASVAFYSGVFGLKEIPAAAKGRRWLSLGKGTALHLLGGRTEPVVDNRSVHLALTSDNLEPILQRLRERRIAWSDFAGTPG